MEAEYPHLISIFVEILKQHKKCNELAPIEQRDVFSLENLFSRLKNYAYSLEWHRQVTEGLWAIGLYKKVSEFFDDISKETPRFTKGEEAIQLRDFLKMRGADTLAKKIHLVHHLLEKYYFDGIYPDETLKNFFELLNRKTDTRSTAQLG